MMKNTLYYGDNLAVLRQHIKDESVDLIYLDPPFQSGQDYNVLFEEKNGSASAAQIKAFEDTWRWDQDSARSMREVIKKGGKAAEFLNSIWGYLGGNDMMAYLSMMAPRLAELKRVLKPTGSIYLHCDPTASHYLKLLMDAVFGGENFRNEITWKRSNSPKAQTNAFGTQHDIILFYSKSDTFTFNKLFTKESETYVKSFRYDDNDGRGPYQTVALVAGGLQKYSGRKEFAFRGVKAPWLYSKEKLERFWSDGLIHKTKTGMYRKKDYLKDSQGVLISDLWTDKEVSPLQGISPERLGYHTQKPEKLLSRILNASSNEGDVVLDPFCGCGTTIAVAQNLNRKWIGIDITHLAIALIKNRLKDVHNLKAKKDYEVIGEPVDLSGAGALAKENAYQFQWWALSLVNARPAEQKKGADKGIDGKLYFDDENKSAKGGQSGRMKQIILSVKSGLTGVSHIRDLRGVIEREKAEIGVLITMEEPSKPMRSEAANAGFYKSPWGTEHPRLQIFTIEELMAGRQIDYPSPSQTNVTFKKARPARSKGFSGVSEGMIEYMGGEE